jgi:hypothetical protein
MSYGWRITHPCAAQNCCNVNIKSWNAAVGRSGARPAGVALAGEADFDMAIIP